ncbi:MAG: flippase [Chloroflexi bacterium]|nr:flippase [Chloroflexota bacterium]
MPNISERLVFVLIGVIVLIKGLGFVWLVVGTQISVLVATILAAVLMIRYIGWFPFEMSPREWWPLLRASLPFGVITLTLLIADRIDTIILSLWTEDVIVGWYNVAYGLMINLTFFSAMLNGALGPTLARTYVGDKQTVNKVYQTSFRILFIASIPLAIGATVLADRIISFLYTDEFLPAVPAFQVLVWALPITALHSLCSAMATASYREKDQAKIRVIGSVANIVMNIFAIPRFGLMGAAVVTLLTELIIFALMFKLVNDQFVLQDIFHIIGKPLLAALVMGGVLLFGHNLNLLLLIGLGVAIYGLMLLATRAVDLKDPASLESVLLKNIGQRLRRFAGGSL